jgi:hypothetical protein
VSSLELGSVTIQARLGSARLLYKLDSARLDYCTSSARAWLSSTRLGSFTGLTVSSFQRVLQCMGFACMRSVLFPYIFIYFFACNKSCLDQPAFGCDAWSRSLGWGCEHYHGFWVKEDKCWPKILNPQCQRTSVCLVFLAINVKE